MARHGRAWQGKDGGCAGAAQDFNGFGAAFSFLGRNIGRFVRLAEVGRLMALHLKERGK